MEQEESKTDSVSEVDQLESYRLGIAVATDPRSDDWYHFRVCLIAHQIKLDTAAANAEVIVLCEEVLANSELGDAKSRLPIIHLTLADALVKSQIGKTDDRLGKAIAHYRVACETIDRAKDPVLWGSAAVRFGLAFVRLCDLAEVPEDALKAASDRARAAVNVFERHGEADLLEEANWVIIKLNQLLSNGADSVARLTALKFLRSGKSAADSGSISAAIAAFTDALLLNPQLGEAYFRRADLYEQSGEFGKAVADYSDVVRLEPRLVEARNNRGLVYSELGKLDDAINDYTEVINIDVGHASAYFNRGIAYENKGELEKAFSDYTDAIRFDARLDAAWHNRGGVYARMGDLERAIADYSEAIRLNPRDAGSFNSRGVVHKKRGDFEKAIADYTEAIRLDPRYAAAYSNRGNLRVKIGQLDEAVADYTKAIEIAPQLAIPYYGRGNAYVEKNSESNAIADFSEAIRLNPEYKDAYYCRAILYEKTGQKSAAEADFVQARKLRSAEKGDITDIADPKESVMSPFPIRVG